MADGVEISVVLPAYNEAASLEDTVTTTLETLGAAFPAGTFEVLVAEDGCSDATPDIAARLASEDDRVRHVHSERRLGRGKALEEAFRTADGETLAYLDTDLATDMTHLAELLESVHSGEYDIATGSRRMAGAEADRPAKRDVPSAVYNWLTRTVLRSSLQDHQCGFKAFDREALFAILDDVEDEHWFWDTEVLVRAQRAGYRIKEFPVRWTPVGDTTVDLVRDVFGMGSAILRTFWQLDVQPRIDRRVSIAAGIALTVLALGLMTVYIDPEQVLAELKAADPVLVGAGALVYLVSWPLRGLRYRDILAALGYREGVGFLTGAIFISQTGNLVFPARAGDAVRAYVIKARRRVPYPTGFASLAAERVFDLLTISTLAGTVLVWIAVTGDVGTILTAVSSGAGSVSPESVRVAAGVAAGVGVLAILSVLAIVASARSERNFVRAVLARVSSDSYVEYVASVLERFIGDLQQVAGKRGPFVVVGATSLLVWVIDVATALLVLAAFDVSLELPTLVAVGVLAVSVGNLAKVLPLSPGGIGLYEAAFTALVASLTPIGPAVAFSAAVLDHAVKNLVTIAGGVVAMLGLNVSLTTAVEEGASAHETATD
jgi:uncharacterized protein (TIRG00374 family)